jgi:hypothetical protein
MLTGTTRIRRTAALAAALGALVASGASARVPEAEIALRSSHDAEPAAAAPSRADMVSRREARATAAWREANPPRIIEVSAPDDGGFDPLSAGIGAAVPLTLILIEVAGRRVLRRRGSAVHHQLV